MKRLVSVIKQHKKALARVEFDAEANIFHGEVINTRDVITFQGESVGELKKAFDDSIEDYWAFCAERGEEPDKPLHGRLTPPYDDYGLAILFDLENGGCYFDESFRIVARANFPKDILDLCLIRPTIGKQYSKLPFSSLNHQALQAILQAKEVYIIGYSLPMFDTLSEFLILSTNPQSNLIIVNIGEEADIIRQRIVLGSNISQSQVQVVDCGIQNWLKQ